MADAGWQLFSFYPVKEVDQKFKDTKSILCSIAELAKSVGGT